MKKKYPTQLRQFGEKIKELRVDEDLTQEDLAKKSGVTRRTIQRVENGEFAAGLHIVFALAQTFKVAPSELLGNITIGKKSK